MDKIVSKLLIYGDMPSDSILMELAAICRDAREERADKETLTCRVYKQVKRLLILATDFGFDRNLWHNYLTFLLMTDENPFSLTCEKMGVREGSVNHFAKSDFKAFRRLFNYDFTWLEEKLSLDCFSLLTHYCAIEKPELMYNKSVSEKVRELSDRLENAADEEAFFTLVTDFYKAFGVGQFGLNKAFRIKSGEPLVFQPINNMEKVLLSDLVGYEIQKKQLVENTKAFVEGKRANNVLLYGDSGTGKSTSIKAIVNEFYPAGLRMIEIYKHQFKDLSEVIARIKNRNYKFIIYMDDLSFEEFEIEYKFLKAVIEGGVETKPDNVLIYATSNRRHLIRETWGDRNDMQLTEQDVHHSDTMEEKLSLATRFGVAINYSKPSREEYFNIARELLQKQGIMLDEEELRREATRWEMHHGGISGRTAQQFVNHVIGKHTVV
ncbi:MAG: ATP-binding protein [Ruminococcaceae bacterium]|nr:ATP-binding protein [Oscillospiraceae bacterium]